MILIFHEIIKTFHLSYVCVLHVSRYNLFFTPVFNSEKFEARIFSKYRTLAEILGMLLMKEFSKDQINLMCKTSGREIGIASEIIEKLNKPILVGIHLLKNGKLPSGETIDEVLNKYRSPNWIGIIGSCISMEIAENSINSLKLHKLPFGYKVNLWGDDEPSPVRKINNAKYNEDAVNLNTVMGKREVSEEIFKNLGKKFVTNGATILGGCCETNPRHISALSSLKQDFV